MQINNLKNKKNVKLRLAIGKEENSPVLHNLKASTITQEWLLNAL